MTSTAAPHGACGAGPPLWVAGVGTKPDLSMAGRFLRFLDREAPAFAFRLIHDQHRDRPALNLYGSLEQHQAQLQRMNAAGYGVFVTVNATDGKGVKAQNVQRIRAVFADQDAAGIPEPEQHMADAIVWSSPGKCHLYWRTDPATVTPGVFPSIQAGIARTFGGDASVTDTPRIMRCPGFHHTKRQPPYRSTLWWADHDSPPWTLDQLRTTFPLIGEELDALERQRTTRAERVPTPSRPPADADALERRMAAWFADRAAGIHHEGRHRLLLDAALQLRHNRLEQPHARRLLLAWRDTLPPRADGTLPPDSEVDECLTWAWDIPPGDPWDLASPIPGGITHEPREWGTLPNGGKGSLPTESHARMRARIPSVQHEKPPTLPSIPAHAPLHGILASGTAQTPTHASMHTYDGGTPARKGAS